MTVYRDGDGLIAWKVEPDGHGGWALRQSRKKRVDGNVVGSWWATVMVLNSEQEAVGWMEKADACPHESAATSWGHGRCLDCGKYL